jgi:hypothetical protein
MGSHRRKPYDCDIVINDYDFWMRRETARCLFLCNMCEMWRCIVARLRPRATYARLPPILATFSYCALNAMAEALAIIGITASIVQLVDFGSRLLGRLETYQSQVGGVPETFRHIKAELPVLLDALRQTQSAINSGVQDETKNALVPAIEGCTTQITLLDDIIVKSLPSPSDSRIKRGGKAIRSLQYDARVEKITLVIRGYVQTLTFHAATAPKGAPDKRHPTPSSTVPFRRDPNFVDRPIFAAIKHKSQRPGSRLALVGLGGVG